MPITIRDWRLVTGMDYYEAVLEAAKAWLAWGQQPMGEGTRPSSLIVRVQMPSDAAYTQYAYECHSFQRAMFIINETYDSVGDGTLVRVEWV